MVRGNYRRNPDSRGGPELDGVLVTQALNLLPKSVDLDLDTPDDCLNRAKERARAMRSVVVVYQMADGRWFADASTQSGPSYLRSAIEARVMAEEAIYGESR